jgi:hypothetical protein
MPAAPLAPPAQRGFASVDPTPGPEDITSFEQARAASPPREPVPADVQPASPAPPATPAREVTLDSPADPDRVNQFPSSVWDDLDKIVAKGKETATSAAKATPAPEAAPAEPAAPAPETPTAPATAPADDSDIDATVQAVSGGIKQLREAYKATLKREKAWKAEQSELTRKATELETKLKTGDVEQVKALAAELETARAERLALEERVKVLDYTKSSEFHDKFTKPIAKALEGAYADLDEMVTVDENGTQRKATQTDFKALLTLPLHEATTRAKQMFGDLAPEILAHRRSIIALKRAEQEALTTASKAADESRQRESVAATQRQQKLTELYQRERSAAEAKFPDLFKAKDGDTEAAAVFEKSRQLVNLLESPDLDDETRVKVGTAIRTRAEAFPHVVLQRNRLQAQVEALTKKLAAFEASAPDRGASPAQRPGDGPQDPWERSMKGLEDMARKGGR